MWLTRIEHAASAPARSRFGRLASASIQVRAPRASFLSLSSVLHLQFEDARAQRQGRKKFQALRHLQDRNGNRRFPHVYVQIRRYQCKLCAPCFESCIFFFRQIRSTGMKRLESAFSIRTRVTNSKTC
jgi:hypothetical protein